MSAKLANIVPVLALCAALFCSCGTREELLESYDSCFVPIPSETGEFVLTPETQSLLLRDVYEISLSDKYREEEGGIVSSRMLALSCPVECDKYDWKITGALDTDEAPIKDVSNGGEYKWTTRNIAMYITMSDDCIFYRDAKETKKTCYYRIHLNVNVGEQWFYDNALLAVRIESEEW